MKEQKFEKVVKYDLQEMGELGNWDLKNRWELILLPFYDLMRGALFLLIFPIWIGIVFMYTKRKVYWRKIK